MEVLITTSSPLQFQYLEIVMFNFCMIIHSKRQQIYQPFLYHKNVMGSDDEKIKFTNYLF